MIRFPASPLAAALSLLAACALDPGSPPLPPSAALPAALSTSSAPCPPLWRRGTLTLPFNPAFMSIDRFANAECGPQDGLLVSSFFNVNRDPATGAVTRVFAPDQVARIPRLDRLNPAHFDPDEDLEVLSDRGVSPPRAVWPNEAHRVPDGVLPFEAVVVPQGFHTTPLPGRLTILNVSDPAYPEYVVHQSTFTPPACDLAGTASSPRFYHAVRFIDMDGDGRKDLVTVRSSFKVAGGFCPPTGELVYFKNPGPALSPSTPWQEVVLLGLPTQPSGPDLTLDAYDFEGDGVPEIIATHFFTRGGAVRLYGAPAGQSWATVNRVTGPFVRERDLAADQGLPFGVQIVDLNGDGKVDVLATNHQPDGCFPMTQSAIPGRVYALEQPASGQLFTDPWPVHILKDNIRPNPTFPAPRQPPGRLAPGAARAFWPQAAQIGRVKPSIVVGGDQASKVWLLQPQQPGNRANWSYDSSVIFDINDSYGPNTTQRFAADPAGVSISTVGQVAVRYDGAGPGGFAELYVPVFEGRRIHVLSFRPGSPRARVQCPADASVACPAP